MNEYYVVDLVLVARCSRGHEEADIHSDGEKNCRWDGKPGNQLSGERIESGRRCVFVPVHLLVTVCGFVLPL